MATRRVDWSWRLEGRKEKAREWALWAPLGARGGSCVSGVELGNTGQFSLLVPGDAVSSCVCECVYASFPR